MSQLHVKQAVILAGGLGTRLRPLTEKIPKPLVEVHGRPFIVWLLEYLQQQGVQDALLLVAYLGEQIEDYLTKNPIAGLNISFSYEKTPLGTAGALKNAEAKLEDSFWLVNGDTFIKLQLSEVERFANINKLTNTIVAFDKPETLNVKPNLKIENQKVLAYKNRAQTSEDFNFVDAGVYLLSKTIFATYSQGKFELEVVWNDLCKKNILGAYPTGIPFYDMGTIERLKNAPQLLF